ncbi:hypothetical protein PS838_03244 [Pseudomonas fluorescens]|nr:hypothetical protein PS838_03244 [Pseudomonas fluorescens]
MSRKPVTRQGYAINYLGWNTHIGTDFDDFLAEQDLADEVCATALKRVISWQPAATMKLQRISKKTLAERMQTSWSTWPDRRWPAPPVHRASSPMSTKNIAHNPRSFA